MRASPLTMAILYFIIGVVLVYFAIQNVSMSGWNIWSVLIVSFATVDILIAFRFFQLHRHTSKANKK